jgi:SnoaL-like protein
LPGKEPDPSARIAFNRSDPDEIATFYAERAVNHQVVMEPIEGRAAIREMFARDFVEPRMVCILDRLSFLKAHGFPLKVD